MPLFQECCVLVPATNLEDFPTNLPDAEAESLLSAWTVLWHPSLLAEMEQLPAWYRADTPPEVLDNRLIIVPTPSQAKLPAGFRDRAIKNKNCHWLEASTREDFLGQLPWDRLPKLSAEILTFSPRDLAVADFFAAGYAALQIQIMTKRLRYTSNLDELHLQNCAVNAAKAFVAGDSKAASDSLHDLFDCLAEERDHYFSSDPHLIDLVLTGESTANRMAELVVSIKESMIPADFAGSSILNHDRSSTSPGDAGSETASSSEYRDSNESFGACLPTPVNLLVDVDAAVSIGKLAEDTREAIKKLIEDGVISWAGGGPGRDVCFDAMTFADAQAALHRSHEKFVASLGMVPPVYGRFAGSTPADLTAALVELGYQGLVPIDFEGGTGFGDEAKVILQAAGVQLEALTAKPIDASSDASFLTIGVRLGESIDRGEISTGLFAHWPGDTCQGFEDLKRVASWSLCLGKFWKLNDYFTEGEHPYHHGESLMVSPHSSRLLTDRVAEGTENPISMLAQGFARAVSSEQAELFAGMSAIVAGKLVQSDSADGTAQVHPSGTDGTSEYVVFNAASMFATAVGAKLHPSEGHLIGDSGQGSDGRDLLIVNPVSVGVRSEIALSGLVDDQADHVFGVDTKSGVTRATIDTPACGFVRIASSEKKSPSSQGFKAKLRKSLFGGAKPIAEKDRLQNEFMEVNLSSKTGAVMGVYSGSRGNRFSLRLVAATREKSANVEMVAVTFRVKEATQYLGRIEVEGVLQRDSEQGIQKIAEYRLEYSLKRGSRFLEVSGEVNPIQEFEGEPWGNYLGLRMAVASESAICRTIVRDKLHRVRSRRLVAPSGLVIDEAERQTLVCGHGLPFHRRVGDRFLDTLVVVAGETNRKFKIDYGIDVKSPVAACRARFCPPKTIRLAPGAKGPEIGWVCHVAPREVLLSAVTAHLTTEGKLAAVVRVVQTHAQTAKVKLRFCRDIAAVSLVDDSIENLLAMSVESLNQRTEKRAAELKSKGDLVEFGLHSHGVSDVLVVFE